MTGAERTPPRAGLPAPGPDAGIDDIQADIEHTRAELGATVEALSTKLNVADKVKGAKRTLATTAGLGVVAVTGVVWFRRRGR